MASRLPSCACGIDRVLHTLHRECSQKRVIIVGHGMVMCAFVVRIERLTATQFLQRSHLYWGGTAKEDKQARINVADLIFGVKSAEARGKNRSNKPTRNGAGSRV